MSDYIERQAVIEAVDKIIERDPGGGNGVVEALKAWKVFLEALPSADVAPVVRCKDCTNAIFNKLDGRKYCVAGFEKTIASAYVAIGNPIFARRDDDFCSRGERREE